MRIIIASTTVPHIDGGGRLIVKWTADALREAGHSVEEFYLPFPLDPRQVVSSMIGLRRTPFSTSCDRLICIRWPAHVLQHENKATWFIHHYRELFDLWDTPYRTVPDNAEGRAYRELLRGVDTAGMRESRDFFTNSLIVRDRVRTYNGLDPEPLFPPLGGDTSKFRADEYGDFIFYPSRVTQIKRQLLAMRAMQRTTTPVRLVIAGRPESIAYENQLRSFVRSHGLEDRVDLRFGWLPEEDKVEYLARCLAVAYIPHDEDSYGYPALEASHSSKALVVTTDAGGALEFVRDGKEGLVAQPNPASLASAFDKLYEDRAMATAMGERSFARRAELNIDWEHTVARLVGGTS